MTGFAEAVRVNSKDTAPLKLATCEVEVLEQCQHDLAE